MRTFQLLLGVSLLATAACSPTNTAGPCEANPPPPECTQTCDPLPGAPETCPAGYHCTPTGTCFAACTIGGNECSQGFTCSADGECIASDQDGNTGPDADCPDVSFTGTQVIPTVELLIDQSGSMDQNFGGVSRWQAVKTALNDAANGVVPGLASQVVFGATLYSSVNGDDNPPCPSLVSVPRTLNNAAAITGLLNDNDPIEDTPTGESIDAVVADFAVNPPMPGSPPIIVLATDGVPDSCQFPDPSAGSAGALQAMQLSVDAAAASYAAGIQLFVLSVGDEIGNDHLQDVANAGAGMDVVTGTAPYYVANDPQALRDAFNAIIGGVLSCDLDIDGNIDPAQAASGTVTLNGTQLNFGTDWVVVDSNTIQLVGAACSTLMSTTNPNVNASFPCGAIIE